MGKRPIRVTIEWTQTYRTLHEYDNPADAVQCVWRAVALDARRVTVDQCAAGESFAYTYDEWVKNG